MDVIEAPSLVPGRVSLIVPCYNVERYLGDFLDSVVQQTYKHLEIILVNDGANEATTTLLRDAVPRLESESYIVKLIEQANKGLGGAVDTGLKHFSGEFLMWPDPDDWLLPNSVERRVALLRKNPEAGLLRTNAQLFIELSQKFEGYFMPCDSEPHWQDGFFEDLFFMRNYHAPVCHTLRSRDFLTANARREIFHTSVSSQNFQMLAPVVEKFPVLQVPEVLAVYRVRADSRSRAPSKSPDKLVARFDQIIELISNTLPRLETYQERAAEQVVNYHWRNNMLPTTFRGGMEKKSMDVIERSSLSVNRKAIASALVRIRCNGALSGFDRQTGRVISRALARLFDAIVRMPEQEVRWGAGPLWSGAQLTPPVSARRQSPDPRN
ncbi:glycosyltransferase family A protein [Pseudoruegeria sp. HB172150]|uniref:glycosyltransferase family A protein n=1 Tax=Pseudoruegeria sp. HB172150 TaxID=2721164 RepID=UPI00155826F8|nr:glycosyltransferase family A protein [Pseudoruegeria sp. HB172150]